MSDGIKKFGISAHVRHRGFQSIFGFIEHLKGTIRYAKNIEEKYGETKEIE